MKNNDEVQCNQFSFKNVMTYTIKKENVFK